MMPFIRAAMLMLIVVGAQLTHTAPASQTIPLHYLDAKDVPALVKPMPGLESITAHPADNTVSVRGEAAAVQAARAKILALDVRRIQYRISATLMRYRLWADERYSDSLVASPVFTAFDGSPARFRIYAQRPKTPRSVLSSTLTGGVALTLTPTHNADGSVTLLGDLKALNAQNKVVQSGRSARRLAPGETAYVVGTTDGVDDALRRRVVEGKVGRGPQSYTGYFVEARVEPLDDRGQTVKPQP